MSDQTPDTETAALARFIAAMRAGLPDSAAEREGPMGGVEWEWHTTAGVWTLSCRAHRPAAVPGPDLSDHSVGHYA